MIVQKCLKTNAHPRKEEKVQRWRHRLKRLTSSPPTTAHNCHHHHHRQYHYQCGMHPKSHMCINACWWRTLFHIDAQNPICGILALCHHCHHHNHHYHCHHDGLCDSLCYCHQTHYKDFTIVIMTSSWSDRNYQHDYKCLIYLNTRMLSSFTSRWQSPFKWIHSNAEPIWDWCNF